MIVSFTSTRRGMTPKQYENVYARMAKMRIMVRRGVHGGCCGGDDQFDRICAELGIDRWIFPSTSPSTRIKDAIFLARTGSKVDIYPPKAPLKRDKEDIVKRGQILIAAPASHNEILHSGTWTTVRYARRIKGLEIIMVFP